MVCRLLITCLSACTVQYSARWRCLLDTILPHDPSVDRQYYRRRFRGSLKVLWTMAPRWQVAALSCAVAAGLLVPLAPRFSVAASYLWTFVALYSASLLSNFAWTVIIWPKIFSPLRHLPHPTGDNFFIGQFPRILKEPSGAPMIEWMNEIPNDGLICYRTLFNTERILPTSPKALAEVLVTKNYEFIKPLELRAGLGRILGVGILLAEGEEHKVGPAGLFVSFLTDTHNRLSAKI